jgi:hypothetical protein
VRRTVVLDADGNERVRRDTDRDDFGVLLATDLNNDGRDELLVWSKGAFRALDRDLKEIWSWPTKPTMIEGILPGSSDRPCEVILWPGLALDGATGRPRWTGQTPLVDSMGEITSELLDPGDSRRLPLFVANHMGATVCSVAMRTNAEGPVVASRGTNAQAAGGSTNDPRWARLLPWVDRLEGPLGPWGAFAAFGLALANVAVPLLIVRWARGRRNYFSIRTLMALPVAAAVPLMVLLTIVPRLPLNSSPPLASESRLFVTGTLAGLPILLCISWMGASLVRVRLRPILALCGLIVLSTLVVAGGWLWLDRRSMAAIEHYGWEGWALVFLPGAYAAAVLWVCGRMLMAVYRFLTRRSVGV